MLFLSAGVLGSISSSGQAQTDHDELGLRVEAVVIKVPNLSRAKDFYVGVLGFAGDTADERTFVISTNSYKIILEQTPEAAVYEVAGIGKVNIAVQVNDLDSAYKRLKNSGVRFISEEPRKEGVGFAYKILDPFGNHLSVIRLDGQNSIAARQPWAYNCGLFVEDIGKETELMTSLGFRALTEKFLPMDNPLFYNDGQFAFVLHRNRPEYRHIENQNLSLVFKGNVGSSKKMLGRRKIVFTQRAGQIFFANTSRCPLQIHPGR